MKPSRFNIVFGSAPDTALYNTRSGAYLRIRGAPPEAFQQLGAASPTDPIASEPKPLDEQHPVLAGPYRDDLLQGGFLIPSDLDELQALKIANLATRFSDHSLTLTVVTTHACNFACAYCYESGSLPGMTRDVQDRVADFVRRHQEGLGSLGVTWFGGEPLLAREVIQRLSVKFLDVCLPRHVDYRADIITNGYLLSREVAEELRGLGVRGAQITLDGTADCHNRRRPLRGGGPTFERVFDNIARVSDILPIVIRTNLDESNSEEACKLVDFLAERGLQNKVQLSFAAVHTGGKGCRDRTESNTNASCKTGILALARFAQEYMRLHRHAFERGFPFVFLPQPRANACAADMANTYVVEPNGKLHKCWQTITDDRESIGTVFGGTPFHATHAKWLLFDPLGLDRCRACRILPLCMGWCPIKIMEDPSGESCNVIRHTILEQLRLYYLNQKREAKVAPPAADSALRQA